MYDATPAWHFRMRTTMRIAGPLLLVAGLGCMVIGIWSFFQAFGTFGEPRYFSLTFVGMPLLAVGGWLTHTGYMGPAATYAAREARPAAGIAAEAIGEGWTRGTLRAAHMGACASCGASHVAGARFCSACGGRI